MRWFSTRMRQNALGLSQNTTAFDRFWSWEIAVCSGFLSFFDPPPYPRFLPKRSLPGKAVGFTHSDGCHWVF
jgi:hypothetical protein